MMRLRNEKTIEKLERVEESMTMYGSRLRRVIMQQEGKGKCLFLICKGRGRKLIKSK